MIELSSAEDMNPLTTSAPVSPSDSQPEEFSIDQQEAQAPEPTPAPSLKSKMVAHEVRVKATGTYPGKTAGQPEPFTEETTSVLVCQTGGVIRLSAAVVPGQLLFLINQDSKREVVAQVIRKRVDRPTSCYVELEFAEPAPRFWGTEFSAASALLPKDAKEVEIAALVTSAEATADEPVEPHPAVSVEEVQALKRQVEVAQEPPKLQLMEASEPAPSMELVPAHAQLSAVPPSPAVGDVESPQLKVNDSSDEARGVVPATLTPLSIENDPASEPLAAPEPASHPIPPMDFSLSLPKTKRSLRARGNFTPGFRGGMLRLAVLTTALIITMLGAAWYKHWIPWSSVAKNTPISAPARLENAKTSAQLGNSGTVDAHAAASNSKAAIAAEVSPQATHSESGAPSNPSAPQAPGTTDAATPSSASSASVVQPGVKKATPAATLAANRAKVVSTPKTSDSGVSSETEAVFVPPKLISSVKAVASLAALRDFERGNVVIDAVVGTAGELTSISVISGPPSMRDFAVETFKQYRYEPATRNGQPIPAHVIVTIRFQFEP